MHQVANTMSLKPLWVHSEAQLLQFHLVSCTLNARAWAGQAAAILALLQVVISPIEL